MMGDEVLFSWEPKRGVGPFRFGDDLAWARRRFTLVPKERGGEGTEQAFEVVGFGLEIYSSGAVIESVTANDSCFYAGRNLIGLRAEELGALFGRPDETPERLHDESSEFVWEFSDLGLSLFVEDGAVCGAACYDPSEDGP